MKTYPAPYKDSRAQSSSRGARSRRKPAERSIASSKNHSAFSLVSRAEQIYTLRQTTAYYIGQTPAERGKLSSTHCPARTDRPPPTRAWVSVFRLSPVVPQTCGPLESPGRPWPLPGPGRRGGKSAACTAAPPPAPPPRSKSKEPRSQRKDVCALGVRDLGHGEVSQPDGREVALLA